MKKTTSTNKTRVKKVGDLSFSTITDTTKNDKTAIDGVTAGTATIESSSITVNPPMSYGWVCPKCGRVNAPWKDHCDCQSQTINPQIAPIAPNTPVPDYPSYPSYPTYPTYPYSPFIWGEAPPYGSPFVCGVPNGTGGFKYNYDTCISTSKDNKSNITAWNSNRVR